MASASLYWGLGAEPPAGSRGRAPGGQGGFAPLKLNAFYLCKVVRKPLNASFELKPAKVRRPMY